MNKLVVACVVLSLSVGCGKKDKADESSKDDKAAEGSVQINDNAALVETYDHGSVAWNVSAEGQVTARVTDEAGKDASKTSKGSIEWNDGATVKRADLVWNDKASALVAQGPEPKGDLTEVRYVIEPPTGAVHGVLDVPEGGLAVIKTDVQASASVDVSAVTPPHGGVVQVVGDQRVEIVGAEGTDEVRVYVLDPAWKPTVAVDAKITIAVGGAAPEVIVLEQAEGGAYFVGRWHVVGEPPRLTIVVRRAGKAHVAIVGWKPGVKLVCAGGPHVKVKVKAVAWGPSVKVKPGEFHGEGHDEGHGEGHAGVGFEVKGNGNGHGKGKLKFK